MTPILYEKDEIDFTSQGLGSLVEIYDVDVEEQRNGLLQLTASYPVSGLRYADISVGRIILAKPNQRDDVHAFRIVSTELDISGYAVTIEADSITYDLTHNLVKHLVVSGNGQAFMTVLKNAVVNPSIFAFYSDIATSSTTSLDYVNPMEAIMGTTGSFLQIWGGELKRENRRVAMFNRRGRDNVATFRLGKNISGLKYNVDISSLVTRIIPTKSIQNDDQTTKTLEGTPVDSKYINNYEQIYTLPLEFTDDTIKTVADLNTAAKGWFTKSANTGRDKPTVTIDIDVLSLQDSADYQDKFKNLESVSLTDTVTVYVPEYGVNVTAIVNELHYDPILDRVTKMTVGTAKQSFADSSRTQLSDLQDKIISVQNQADATAVSADGKSTNYYGSVEPSHPQEGDTWFWVNGDKSGIKVFVNGDWVDLVDSDTQEKIAASVTEAVTQAKAHTDEVKQGLSSDIATAKSQATSQANAAEANAKSEATSLFSTAQNALSDAKTDLTNSIASEASARNQAVAAANSQAQTYANQAKADAISAASSADGVINKKIDDTASSITSTVSQNKKDAEGKITTAQSTATQALNGLSSKVDTATYNSKTGQLSTDVTNVTQTANQAKTDIVSIKQKDGDQDAKMNTIVSDANGTKQTVSDLQTAQGKQSGYISTLQQRADGFDATVTKVDNLAVGGRNYVQNSSGLNGSSTVRPTLMGATSGANATITYPSDGILMTNDATNTTTEWYYQVANAWTNLSDTPLTPGKQITFSADVMGTAKQVALRWGSKEADPYQEFKAFDINNTSWTRVVWTFTLPVGTLSTYLRIHGAINNQYATGFTGGETLKFRYVKIEDGNIPTAWTPAPEEVDSATAKAQLTADNASLAVGKLTNADGVITKAQADIRANADAITQKVSKTVYDQKTGDLTTAVSKAQTTADGVVTTVGNYQTSNDKRVGAAESTIEQHSKDITARVTKTDYDNNNSNLNTRFTKVEATADGASTTVGKLQTTVNNLGQINQLFNTEFSPDFAGWYAGNLATSGAYVQSHTLGPSDGWSRSSEKYNGSNVINFAVGNTASFYSDLIPAGASTPISVSMSTKSSSDYTGSVTLAFYIRYYDANKNYISQQIFNSNRVTSWTKFTLTDTTPANTAYVVFNILTNGNAGTNSYSQPMLVFSDNVGTYVQGNYNNNAALAQVKITADSVSNFVRDSSGNISSNFQTALSKTSIITGSMLATSIQKQTSSQISSALTDNNGKIISLINQDSSGVQIGGENITLDGNTTVTGDFYAKGGNFKNLNASNMTVGTLNGNQVNVTNINANNIVAGTISGANLSINLNTGAVLFRRGRIYSSDYTTDINIDSGYISTSNSDTRVLLKQGVLQLINPNFIDLQTDPYLEISNMGGGVASFGGSVTGRDNITLSNSANKTVLFPGGVLGVENLGGIFSGKGNDGKWYPTRVGGANRGVIVSGGNSTSDITGASPYIFVGVQGDLGTQFGNRILINGELVHIPSAYKHTSSSSANVVVANDGALIRSSSASKYKLDIKNDVDLEDSLKLIEVPLSTWVDKHEHEDNGSNERYFGMIAEDLRDAGLEYLVQCGDDNEVEGINYDRVALLLIPLVKKMYEKMKMEKAS
ncbi:phage tail spike protein [Leuconostoc gasicomitatum]|uniref:phage tail spike protein n=1 Tax=Leuconostoc gasicomitatum TaxID=115778 RepID=UPI001CC7C491|nr:phage tail spike protein [Leuconostoc gasicomitatum]MBZ5968963.1 phage tail protein [Leuconostoc gasicomitatum]